MWGMIILIDTRVPVNRPDSVIHNKKKKKCYIMDVAVPVDRNSVKNITKK